MGKGPPLTQGEAKEGGDSSSGPETRFRAWAAEYGKFLRQTIVRLCPKHLGLDFDDIEQEAQLRLWRAIHSEREIADPASYLYRIAVTATIDAVRRVRARREESLPNAASDSDPKVALAAGPESSPEEAAGKREVARRIEAAMARVAESRRLPVSLHLQGFTSLEVAGLMGWREPKARNLIYRGLKDLRRELGNEGIDGETQ